MSIIYSYIYCLGMPHGTAEAFFLHSNRSNVKRHPLINLQIRQSCKVSYCPRSSSWLHLAVSILYASEVLFRLPECVRPVYIQNWDDI